MELTIDQALQQGVAAHKEGKLQDAERLYRAILQAQPFHPDANHNLGVLAVAVGKLLEALQFFKQALDASPNVEQFWLSYIDALIKAELFTEAKTVLAAGERSGVSAEKLVTFHKQLQVSVSSDANKAAKKQTLSEKRKRLAEKKKFKKRKAQGASSGTEPSQDLLNQLLGHYQAGRLEDAETLARSLTQKFPKHPFAWKVLGVVLKQMGRLSESLLPAQKSVALSPDDADAHSNLGVVLRDLGRLDEAEVSYRQAIAIRPNFAEAHSNLGNILLALDRSENAEASLRQAITLKPDLAEAHYNLGDALKALNKIDEARESYQQAISIKPDYAKAHNSLGGTLKQIGELDEAEASYKQAIALRPDFAEAHNNLGNTLKKLGRLNHAEASYRQAIALNPDYAEARSNLGVTLKNQGRLGEAQASFAQAIALKPGYAEAHYNLANTLKALGNLREAEAAYRTAIALEKDFAAAHSNLGLALHDLGRLDEAEVSFKNAIALNDACAAAHGNLGNTLHELGRTEEAEASLMQAVALNPRSPVAFFNLYGLQKNIQSAEYWIDKCLRSDKNYAKAIMIKAALRFYQGDRAYFDELMKSDLKQHPYARSFSWVFKLPSLPELKFDRWKFFDAVIEKSVTSRPFYEFGVWRAASFRYLVEVFKKGYGFDTFSGLPQDWNVGSHTEGKGKYTNDGQVPVIEGGHFTVGEFKDTLPVFFAESRPKAALINFDADLYSSTICALNCSKSIIDKHTVLVFDEFLMNESWEQDEFKALEEFCATNQLTYEVIALSFFTKQVAVKLVGI